MIHPPSGSYFVLGSEGPLEQYSELEKEHDLDPALSKANPEPDFSSVASRQG